MNSHLHTYSAGGVSKFLHQMMKELLSYPFFGGQSYPTVAPDTEDLTLITVYARL